MRNLLLVGALEDLDLKKKHDKEPDDDKDDKMSAATLAILEAGAEFESEVKMADEMFAEGDEFNAAVERLEGIAQAIETHGISRSMMEAVDPNGELVAAGICCAYEELSDVPVKDENAVGVVEGIANKVNGSIEAVGAAAAATFTVLGVAIGLASVAAVVNALKLLVMAAKKFVKMVSDIRRIYGAHILALSSVEKKLAAISEFDEEKFKGVSVKAYGKADFEKVHKAAEAVISTIKGGSLEKLAASAVEMIEKEELTMTQVEALGKKAEGLLGSVKGDAELLGIKIETFDVDGSTWIQNTKPTITVSSETAEKHGWKASEASAAVKSSIALFNDGSAAIKEIEGFGKSCDTLAKSLKEAAKKSRKISPEEKKAIKAAVNAVRNVLALGYQLAITSVRATNDVGLSALNVAKAAVACKKAGENVEPAKEGIEDNPIVITPEAPVVPEVK